MLKRFLLQRVHFGKQNFVLGVTLDRSLYKINNTYRLVFVATVCQRFAHVMR